MIDFIRNYYSYESLPQPIMTPQTILTTSRFYYFIDIQKHYKNAFVYFLLSYFWI